MCTRPRLMYDKFHRIINTVPCKICIECRNLRREDFTQRLLHEWETFNYIGSFISLTYSDNNLPILLPENSAVVGSWFGSIPPAYGSTLSRSELTQFADKLQKRIKRKYKHSCKYVLVGEYGEDGHRPHYHGIILGLPYSDRKLLFETWKKGRIDIQPISHADIRYTLKYIDKQIFGYTDLYYNYGDFEPPFAHFSKGLGVSWIEKNLHKFDEDGVLRFTDYKQYSLNPYYRDKYRFKKIYKKYSDSVYRFARQNNISLEEAYEKRQKIIELHNQRKELKNTGHLYNVDTIEKIKFEDLKNEINYL